MLLWRRPWPSRYGEEWFKNKLPADEQARRKEFKKKFKPHYDDFRALPLGTARHISEHRGVAPVTVRISRRFGVTYVGTATERIPLSETPQIDDPNLAFLAKAHPIQPKLEDFAIEKLEDFAIEEKPLFSACEDYLNSARSLIEEGRPRAPSSWH